MGNRGSRFRAETPGTVMGTGFVLGCGPGEGLVDQARTGVRRSLAGEAARYRAGSPHGSQSLLQDRTWVFGWSGWRVYSGCDLRGVQLVQGGEPGLCFRQLGFRFGHLLTQSLCLRLRGRPLGAGDLLHEAPHGGYVQHADHP